MGSSQQLRSEQVLEFSPSFFATTDGKWISEPPPTARVIGRVGLPAIDSGAKQILLEGSYEDKKDLNDLLPNLALDAKDLYHNAVTIGAAISGVSGYIEGAKMALDVMGIGEDSDELKELKVIGDKLNQINYKIDVVIWQNIHINSIDKIEGIRENTQQHTRTFLESLTEHDRESLEDAIDALHTEVSAGLLDAQGSLDLMLVPWNPGYYADTPWYYTQWLWGFRRLFAGEMDIPLLGTWPTGKGRWDLRPWLAVLAQTVTTLIMGHAALDPSYRTTGVYRDYLKSFAEALRAIARRLLEGIQMTRSFDFAKDPNDFMYDDKFDFLSRGWPVGAVDSLLGSSAGYVGPTFPSYAEPGLWKPTQQGFPLIEQTAVTQSSIPLFPATLNGFALLPVLLKADADAKAAWFRLAASSPAMDLYALADLFDQMATPPNYSETVVLEGPTWTGLRVPAGSVQVTVDGQFCEAKSFTADVFHVKREGTVTIRIQPSLYRWGSHTIKYRLLLESHDNWSHYPLMGSLVDQTELQPGSGTVYLESPLFHWDVEKPISFSDRLGMEQVEYVMTPPPPLDQTHAFYVPLEGLSIGSVLTMAEAPEVNIAEGPLEQLKGRLTRTGETKTLPFSYERTDDDGSITIVLGAEMGQENTMLWLVVEEPVGFPPPGSKQSIRSMIPLAMIGIERQLPHSYFAYSDYCTKRALSHLHDTIKKRKLGQPIPEPDPLKDKSFADYVGRVRMELLRG